MWQSNDIPQTYTEAGVDLKRGARFTNFIKGIKSKVIPANIGGFSGGIELDTQRYKNPVILSTTDGVGTKILVAKKLHKYDTIGIDLVAMNVNDLIVCGAEPLLFLDYIACGQINEHVMKQIIKGIIKGCEQAHCLLAGGETAEMPDVYKKNDFDLAGFAVGIVNKEDILPKINRIRSGDIILGLASTGIHSNGFSLARKVVPQKDISAWEKLLLPTKIYMQEIKTLCNSHKILAAAHITGGGLIGNLRRVIPMDMVPRLNFEWQVPEIFDIIKNYGNISEQEMQNVFNMGIGLAVIINKNNVNDLFTHAKTNKINIKIIGSVENG